MDDGDDFFKLVEDKLIDLEIKEDGGKVKFDLMIIIIFVEVKEVVFKLKDGEVFDVIIVINIIFYVIEYYVVKMVKN